MLARQIPKIAPEESLAAGRSVDELPVRSPNANVKIPLSDVKMPDYRAAFYSQYHRLTSSDRQMVVSKSTEKQYLSRWKHHLPNDRDGHVLDIGCGSGDFLLTLKNIGYRSLWGLDLNEREVGLAQERGLVNVNCGGIELLASFSDGFFSAVSALNVFEHLKKDELLEALRLCKLKLAKGGKLIIVVPNAVSPFGGTTRYWDFSHEQSFTPASWRQLATLFEYEDLSFEEYGPIGHSAVGIMRVIAWNCIKLGLDAYSYVEVARPRDSSRVYTADMKVILTK